MNVTQILKDIKAIRIQGATNVAKTTLELLEHTSKVSKSKNMNNYVKELMSIKDKVLHLRPTEPLAENISSLLINEITSFNEVKDAKQKFPQLKKKYLSIIKESKEKITNFGSELIRNNSTVLTHCHSSNVVDIFKKAKDNGKKFKVICTETRPLYQGRLTAKNLLSYGIDTTMIVDSGVSNVVKDVDMAFVGADLLTATGEAVNKIGSTNVALACKRVNIPFYVCSTVLKIDRETIRGKYPSVEQRDGREIWAKPPRKLKFINPAFEIIPNDLISAIITEKGVVRPDSLLNLKSDFF